jgi:hypothetical protein
MKLDKPSCGGVSLSLLSSYRWTLPERPNGIFPLLAVETFSPNCNTKRKHTLIREVDRNLSKKAFSKKLAILVSVFLLFGIGFAHASAVSDVTTYRGGIIL